MSEKAGGAKVWMITGVSRGLGREIARAALARGDRVVGTSRSGEADLESGAGELTMLALDLAEPGRVEPAVAEAVAAQGRIDVLVNNAGVGLLGAVEESDEAEAAHVFEVNFFGPLRLIRAVLPTLRAQGGGRIVNISSIAGLAPMAGSGLYAAAKFAMEGMSASLAQEVAPLGIRVMLVEPGAFRTDFLSEGSVRIAATRIVAYDETSGASVRHLQSIAGRQAGDPSLAARAIVDAVDSPEAPLHLVLGSDALSRARAGIARFTEELDRWEPVSRGTDFAARDA